MSSKAPIIRPISVKAVIFQFGLIAVVSLVTATLGNIDNHPLAFFFTAVGYGMAILTARALFTKDHRRGISLFRAGRFGEAAPAFEESYRNMTLRPWIDRFRWLVLGSASSMSYREMALCNAAFCYSQTGEGARAVDLYEQALREFPECGLARVSLNMMTAGRDAAADSEVESP